MASTLKYGSSGSDVKKLQQTLNNSGYTLDVDGQFGAKTQAAVMDYQKKNNLGVDGIVGTQTWGALNGASASAAKTTTPASTSSAAKNTAAAATASRPEYKKSTALTAAEKALSEYEAAKPAAYNSAYADKVNALLDDILAGKKFEYNAALDPLYNQYKENYVKNGQLAMEDTAAQAAALTGGYGSSYGTSAAAQAYQRYLTELNDKIPELRAQAYAEYADDQNRKINNLGLLQNADAADYAKYRDSVSDYYDELGYKYQKASDMSDDEYNMYLQLIKNYENDREFAEAKRQYDEQFAESKRQYDEQFAYQKEQDALALAAAQAKSSGGGSGSRSSSSGSSGSRGSSSSGGGSGSSRSSSSSSSNKNNNPVAPVINDDSNAGNKSDPVPSFNTYEEAAAYLQKKGVSGDGGLMTYQEWRRRKAAGSKIPETEYDNYSSYLHDFVDMRLSE